MAEDFRVAGRTGQATWRVVAREPDRLWRIDATIDGQPAGSVTYVVSAASPGSTNFTREFEYPSRNLLFALVNWTTLRARIGTESDTAVKQLKTRLESAR